MGELIQRHKQSSGVALLDVACGTGGHIQHLPNYYAVEGLDLDPAILVVARRNNPGVTFHEADLTAFELSKRFDVVMCLFSSIGYAGSVGRLNSAVRTFERHLLPGGVVLVEPWITVEDYQPGHVSARFVDSQDLKVARINVSAIEGRVAVLNFHYLVATPEGVRHFTERHELGLYTDEEYRRAFEQAGLEVSYEGDGLTGRGMYIGAKPLSK
ncbi:MAG: class I SAM-dependent methyltransferase [Chloroflexota bacterium]|nr:class I SAM-dependent methyltransferase [Chloroflexota bacterium]